MDDGAFTYAKLQAVMQQARSLPSASSPMRFVSNSSLVIVEEDWSQVRSKGRAARRRKQGHPQRIVVRHYPDPKLYHVPANGVIYGHPVTIEHALRATQPTSASGCVG
ncbi:hypothetical protein Pan3_27 [Pseudanabaena phage Pan3]|nr:hypothetical protein Pan3_27 [Pseudanabaena phage Pan3]